MSQGQLHNRTLPDEWALQGLTIHAERAAKVKATPVKAGDSLAVDQVIMEFE